MAYLVIEDFRAGQDDRRADVAAPVGTLRTLTNAHITRGGEIEKRKAFVSKYTLPAGTFGLATTTSAVYVFGSGVDPGVPAGVTYQRLQHPTASAMTAIKSVDVFDGLLYVAAEFADNSIFHFYDGTRVDDFADGLARGGFEITGGTNCVAATTTFEVTGGTNNPGTNQTTSVTVDGAEVLGTAVDWVTSNDATATAIAAQITTTDNGWSATAAGAIVTLTSTDTGTDDNGLAVVITNAGDVTTGAAANTAGGTLNGISSITVNGVEVLNSTVKWTTSNSNTAALVAAQITSYTSSPEYTGGSSDGTVNVIASTSGTGPNGYVVAVTTVGTATAGTPTAMAGGSDTSATFTPGTFVSTFRTKMYTTSGSLLHFSKLDDPTAWQTSDVGAGFINMSSHASGSEDLQAVAPYFSFLAVFAAENIQIWAMDPDPDLNAAIQVLRNTGTFAPRSVAAFGDGDVAYLSLSGVRSLRARDSSNAAIASELGAPIDDSIITYVNTLTAGDKEKAVAILEPNDKRYWIAVGDKIYVLSLFSASSIAAWSEYDPGFEISDFATQTTKLFARSGDTIYLYGGDDGATYDSSVVTVEMPFSDGKQPATEKDLTSIDATVRGNWTVSMAVNPAQPTVFETLGILTDVTWQLPMVGAMASSTHYKFKLVNEAAGYAKLSNFAFHFTSTEAD